MSITCFLSMLIVIMYIEIKLGSSALGLFESIRNLRPEDSDRAAARELAV
jgi:hypothetical protein